jgi:class 3 adenylate cyclase
LSRLRGLRSDLIDPAIAAHHGRTVKRTGDGILIEFRSVVGAMRCAIEVQNGTVERNAGLPQDRHIVFRVGIHLGDVVEEADGDLMGDGVNIAARLEGICAPGGRDGVRRRSARQGAQVVYDRRQTYPAEYFRRLRRCVDVGQPADRLDDRGERSDRQQPLR